MLLLSVSFLCAFRLHINYCYYAGLKQKCENWKWKLEKTIVANLERQSILEMYFITEY